MLTKWSLKGFKSFYEDTNFEMDPLTIFTGANSSGKSSVIQSILLTTQTLQNNIRTKSIILNGQILRLGSFDDIHSYNSESGEITVGFELRLPFNNQLENENDFYTFENYSNNLHEKQIISCVYKFSIEDATSELSSLQPIVTYSKISHRKESTNEVLREIEVKKRTDKNLNIFSEINEKIDNFSSLQYEVLKINDKEKQNKKISIRNIFDLDGIHEEVIGAELHHFIPYNIVSKIDENELHADRIIKYLQFPDFFSLPNQFNKNLLNKEFFSKLHELFFSLFKNSAFEIIYGYDQMTKVQNYIENLYDEHQLSLYESVLDSINTDFKNKLTRGILPGTEDLMRLMKDGLDPKYKVVESLKYKIPRKGYSPEINNFFNNHVKYLGPLRDEPKPIYPNTTFLDSKDVGFKGEYTAAVLELYKHTVIDYISPTDLLKDHYSVKKGELIEAVLEWLEYMGVSTSVKTFDRGKLGHELQVQLNKNGKFNDLTNVGVGVSQVLPILVMALLASPNSTMIFEQPELHLHPKVQTRLADFYLTMIYLKKQCILETHSEYIVNRLRYKAVSSEKDNIPENVSVYFINQQEGKSNYEKLQINENGVISEWPSGFFDEHEITAMNILKKAREKRMKKGRL